VDWTATDFPWQEGLSDPRQISGVRQRGEASKAVTRASSRVYGGTMGRPPEPGRWGYRGWVVYRVLAEATMVVHFGFVVYVVLGGFLAWRWPRTIFLHLVAAGWGLLITVFSLACPLTPLEDALRRRAGQQGLSTGFIDTYIEGVLYPQQLVEEARAVAAVLVLIAWVGLWVRWRRGRRDRARAGAGSAAA
jgi:hypothetical protein